MMLPSILYFDGTRYDKREEALASPQLFRQPHDTEIVDYNLDDKMKGRQYRGDGVGGPVRNVVTETGRGMPEVYRLLPEQAFYITDPWRDLVCAMNPKLSRDKALSIYAEGAFLCNTQDFLCDAARWCGGALAEGEKRDGNVYLKSLLVNEQIPTVEFMNNHPEFWYYGTTIIPNGENRFITRKGLDGNYYPVRVPFVLEVRSYVPAGWLDELPADFNPANYDPRITSH